MRYALQVHGEALQRERLKATLGLTELADLVGVPAPALIDLEGNGWCLVPGPTLRRILEVLDCSFLAIGRIVPAPRRSEVAASPYREASE